MIEVVRFAVRHSDLLHDANRSLICRHCKGQDLVETELVKCVVNNGLCAFRRESLSPHVARQAPTNFDAGREVRFECGRVKSDVADEAAVTAQFSGVKSESLRTKVIFDAIDH